MSIQPGEWLGFLGSVLGAGAGVGAAFLAVWLQGRSDEKGKIVTTEKLIERLEAAAARLKRDAASSPALAVRAVFRAFRALRDATVAMRTTNASIATIAARLEHTELVREIQRLRTSPGINAPDAAALADELTSLCVDLRSYLRDASAVED